jgi:hypothetical protein
MDNVKKPQIGKTGTPNKKTPKKKRASQTRSTKPTTKPTKRRSPEQG